ncbi:hypothetical protein Rhopal_004904-T1 [Rhodotorula paludigena]|uniref:Proteophosphoglycan ppg4 n=1 Tax=Rhodotorula paludigena TaxID=86838 RepID=A0AAV5GRK0_9BASI|nr:hypothetical protein Rhopal_004904-T1 [Rhodotorula paludigena]
MPDHRPTPAIGLERWRESEDEDDWGGTAVKAEKGKGKAVALPPAEGETAKRGASFFDPPPHEFEDEVAFALAPDHALTPSRCFNLSAPVIAQSHVAHAPDASARPPLSRQTTPRSRIPKRSSSPLRPPPSPSPHYAPSDSDCRCETPSLTEDSFNSLTTGEEVVTEADDAPARALPSALDTSFGARLKSISGSKKWRFGRSGSTVDLSTAATARQEPEIRIVDRHELSRARRSDSPRSNLPRPVLRPVNGRASNGTVGTSGSGSTSGGGSRVKHSSNTSVSTSSGASLADARTRRTSLHFAPFSFSPSSRRGSLASPTESVAPSWREYMGSTTEDDGGETTSAEMSDFGDSYEGEERRRPVGGRADASQGKKRKLTKKRPASGLADETHEMLSQSALGLADDGTSERPLLAPSIFSTSSGGSSVPSSNRTVLTRARSQYHPTLPFAQDSEDEVARGTARAPRQRSATGPVSSSHLATPAKNEKGEVVELDKEWLGVVPFPPSPRPSTDQPEPVTPTRSGPRPTSRMLRKASGAQTKSHPPVTAEARATKRSSGIGSAISNLLSRSTSALPLGGKRAPSPAPSAKSVKSSKSGILRRPSSRLGRASGEQGGREKPKLPKSPSLSALQKGASSSPPPPVKASTPTPPPPTPVIPRGQLNPEFRMPRPVSNVSTASSGASDVTSASTIMPLESYRDALPKRNPRQERVPPVPPLPRNLARPLNAGHRPSVSLSSLMPLRPSSPRPQPFRSERTTPEPQFPLTLSVDGDGDGPSEPEASVTRRNSLSDLRIPARITNAQKKIEEDLERVKQFAKAIEDLKTLQRQYNQLIQVFVEPPPPSPGLLSPDQPSSAALNKTAQAARRVELDFSSTWEQVQTLINLADGAPTREGLKKTSPGTLASRRDRCVSLAPERELHRLSLRAASGSETETETSLARNGSVRAHQRRPSSSSFETDASVAVRQREMLRGVLAPPAKGASLPSRAPPAPRPPLPRLDSGASTTVSPTSPRSAAQPLSPASARRVSRGGVFGIREFLLRLRSKATEELAASVGDSEEDWDASPPRNSLLDFDAVLEADMGSLAARRERTRSVIVSGGTGGGAAEGDKMVLTTEAMPHLLDKVREVREACEACIGLLKGLTV